MQWSNCHFPLTGSAQLNAGGQVSQGKGERQCKLSLGVFGQAAHLPGGGGM